MGAPDTPGQRTRLVRHLERHCKGQGAPPVITHLDGTHSAAPHSYLLTTQPLAYQQQQFDFQTTPGQRVHAACCSSLSFYSSEPGCDSCIMRWARVGARTSPASASATRTSRWHTTSSARCAARQSPTASASETAGKAVAPYELWRLGEKRTCLYLCADNGW